MRDEDGHTDDQSSLLKELCGCAAGSGLSSSSAFVCVAALSVLAALHQTVPRLVRTFAMFWRELSCKSCLRDQIQPFEQDRLNYQTLCWRLLHGNQIALCRDN